MIALLNTSIGRLRLAACLEGISYLVLLFIAMPRKYLLHDPSWVEAVGMVHGILFIALIITLWVVMYEKKWTLFGNTLKVFIASLLPFGTFYIERTLLRHNIN